jgi:hypothetical protein
VDSNELRVSGSADRIEVAVDARAALRVAGNLCHPAMKRIVAVGIHNLVFGLDGGGKGDGW